MKLHPVLLLFPFLIQNLCAEKPKITLSVSPLSADQVAVYRAFLAGYNNGSPGSVNLASKTIPFDISETGANGCLRELKLRELPTVSSTTHSIGTEAVGDARVKIVDPDVQSRIVNTNDPSKTIREGKRVDDAVKSAFESGLLSLSEIAFDEKHEHAVLQYGFHCGVLCGHGGTMVFKKVGDSWKEQKSHCGVWMAGAPKTLLQISTSST
jgi:hypothetical protein